MKKILKILFAIMAPAWFAFSCAHAEEVELNPTDYFTYSSHFQDNTHDVEIVTDTCVDTPPLNLNGHSYERWLQGNFLTNGSAKVAYKTPAMTDSDHSGLTFFGGNKYTNLYYYLWDPYSSYTVPSFQLTLHDSYITLDVTNLLAGWYRYEAEIYVGVTVFGNVNGPTFDPFFTYDTTEIPLGVNGKIYYVGTEDLTTGANQLQYGTQLVHFHFEDTWEVDPEVEEYTWNITPAFQYLISSLQYSGGLNTSQFGVATNNRFQSSLFGNVEPIVSPSPTPTPSPNQDIINNDNTNTTNIITTINDGFDALSAVFEGSIYGLTDLIFGSASDWIDFFSDVQDDMEEYLPVVTFFQSCKNILANFFNVESTDPTALQYIAGWQSDIYTLHIGALPLVLPEGTFNFFPEVNFNLNNPFMNEIRPYWLTFSNVLITLLFLRYLANYLFRWTQLLTGDTSVAFQLFHHAPDELENLGTDPYDLAGDYSYDSIDSANHDLYQDAEAHYGHGAARYLSKVFHSK